VRSVFAVAGSFQHDTSGRQRQLVKHATKYPPVVFADSGQQASVDIQK
jgi:hypothetical protein